MNQSLYRATVTNVLPNGVMVAISDLGQGAEFGPCQTGDFPLNVNDQVLVAQAGGYREDLVVVGPLLMFVAHPDATYGLYDFATRTARDTKFNGFAQPTQPTFAMVENINDLFYWNNFGSLPTQVGGVIDDFSNATISAVRWSGLFGGSTFDTVNKRAVLPVISAYSGIATPGSSLYTLVNSYLSAQMTITTSTSRELYMEAVKDANNRVQMLVSGTILHARVKVAGSYVYDVTATYSATSHAYWRFRHDNTYIWFETSSDGHVWNYFGSYLIQVSDPVWSTVYLNFSAGYFGSETASNAYVSNVNAVLWWHSLFTSDRSLTFNNITALRALTAASAAISGSATVGGSVAVTGSSTIGGNETVTGTVTAANEVITGTSTLTLVSYKGASLWYNGTPGVSTLYASMAPSPGTDPFGTAYPRGLGFYRNINELISLTPPSDLPHVYSAGTVAITGAGGNTNLRFKSGVDTTLVGDSAPSFTLWNKNGTYTLAEVSADITQIDGQLQLNGGPPIANGVLTYSETEYEGSFASGRIIPSTSSLDLTGCSVTLTTPASSTGFVNFEITASIDIACIAWGSNTAAQVFYNVDGALPPAGRVLRFVGGVANNAASLTRRWKGTVTAGASHNFKLQCNLAATPTTTSYQILSPNTKMGLRLFN